MKNLLLGTACAAMLALGACTPDQVASAQSALTNAKAATDAVCALPKAPTFCTNPVDQAKINAAYNVAQHAFDAYNAGGDQNALIQSVVIAVADYVAITAAFRSGH